MALDVVSWGVGSDNYLDLVGIKNTFTGTYPTDAVVTVTVRNRAGATVTGLVNVPATYVPGTTGPLTAYRITASAAVTPPIGLYKAKGTASKDGLVLSKHAVITVEEA